MRVRILKDFTAANRVFLAGQVTEVGSGEASGWLKVGLVMQDKSLDGATERKTRRKQGKSKRS